MIKIIIIIIVYNKNESFAAHNNHDFATLIVLYGPRNKLRENSLIMFLDLTKKEKGDVD